MNMLGNMEKFIVVPLISFHYITFKSCLLKEKSVLSFSKRGKQVVTLQRDNVQVNRFELKPIENLNHCFYVMFKCFFLEEDIKIL